MQWLLRQAGRGSKTLRSATCATLFITSVSVFVHQGEAIAQYRSGNAPVMQESCPQGREIRARKHYSSTMTDCEVLDADTMAENQNTQRPILRSPTVSPAAAMQTSVRAYSTRMINAIRMAAISDKAADYCPDIVQNGEAGQDLFEAGFQISDLENPEYQRIRQDAKNQLGAIDSSVRCTEIWRLLGPRGSYGRQLVTLKK
jgi:hypothetical protein